MATSIIKDPYKSGWYSIKQAWTSGSVSIDKSKVRILLFRVNWKNGIVTDCYSTTYEANGTIKIISSYYYSGTYYGCVAFNMTNSGDTDTLVFDTTWMVQHHGNSTLNGMNAIISVDVWAIA